MWPNKYKYDAFISHAVEDKLAIANELCSRLEEKGLKVWYSGKELKVGDSLERTILKGLERSRYGIVIFSPTYVKKNWPMKEFYFMMSREIESRKIILPVLYKITAEELRSLDIMIADRWSLSYHKGMDFVVEQLLMVIHNRVATEKRSWIANLLDKRISAVLVLGLLALASFFVYSEIVRSHTPPSQVVEAEIQKRINDLERKAGKDHELLRASWDARPATMADVSAIYTNFSNLKTHYRNEYELDNGFRRVQSRKNVEAALKVDVTSLTPYRSYSLSSPRIFLASREQKNKPTEAHYSLENTQPVHYTISAERLRDEEYEVSVTYSNNIRYMFVNLSFPTAGDFPKRHQLILKALLPKEKYTFINRSEEWVLKSVE